MHILVPPCAGLALFAAAAVALAAAPAWAEDDDEWPLEHDGKWYIPIDVGVGPAAHWFPAPYRSAVPELGFSVGTYAVVAPEIVQMLKARIQVPPKYQALVDRLDLEHEWHVRRAPLTYLPTHLVLSPPLPTQGKPTSAYGIAWDPLLLDLHVGLGNTEAPVQLLVGAGLPTASLTWLDSGTPQGGAQFAVGLGAQASAALTLRFTWAFSVSLEWRSDLRVSAPLVQDLSDGAATKQSWALWHVGTASLGVHFRLPTYQKVM
ncbi:MAG: hypothetical protein EXR79_09260 [Myxococcales bacterium]|nr:hypothetical protein [Myxococcales bacterium]